MSAAAHAEREAENKLRVTFSEQVVAFHQEEEEPQLAGRASQLVDCFGPDATVICAVCLGRCSREATLCAGESDAAAVPATPAVSGTWADHAGTDASHVDPRGPMAGRPDVEQGALLAAEPPRQGAALTQTALRLRCSHVFHVDCLSLWMKRGTQPSCPTCSAAVAPAQLTHSQASSPEIRELIDQTVAPPRRSVRWTMPILPVRRVGARREGPAATVLGSRWQCKEVAANLALHLGYPMALFGGIGGLLYLWSEG